MRVNVYEPGNAAATTANIVASQGLVRLSFAADLVHAMVWLVLAVTLQYGALLVATSDSYARRATMRRTTLVGVFDGQWCGA